MTGIDFLKKVEIFNDLDEQQLASMQICWDEMESKRGDKIIQEGDDAVHMWVVTEGEAGFRFDLACAHK
jgi:hypothetical protein